MMEPLLRIGPFSDRVWLITRYRVEARVPKDKTKPASYAVIASKKIDVTDEFVAAIAEWRKAKRRQRASAARSAPPGPVNGGRA
jgi:hypothetical protein